MKKSALILFLVTALYGCKKDYTCECVLKETVTSGGGIYETTGTSTVRTLKAKKTDAGAGCSNSETVTTESSTNIVRTQTETCELKK